MVPGSLRVIHISCENLFHNQVKINMFKLKSKYSWHCIYLSVYMYIRMWGTVTSCVPAKEIHLTKHLFDCNTINTSMIVINLLISYTDCLLSVLNTSFRVTPNCHRLVSSTGRALDCKSSNPGSIPERCSSLSLWLIIKFFLPSFAMYYSLGMYRSN